MGNSAKRTARDFERAQKRETALKLRLEGKTYNEIADIMGYADHKGPRDLIQRTIKDVYGPKANEYMAVTLARLEALLDAVWDPALKGDISSHEQARKVVADIRKMLGLDKPVVTEIGGPNGKPLQVEQVDVALDKLAERLKDK